MKRDPFFIFLAIIIACTAITILVYSMIQMFHGNEFGTHLILAVSMIANAMMVYQGKLPREQN